MVDCWLQQCHNNKEYPLREVYYGNFIICYDALYEMFLE